VFFPYFRLKMTLVGTKLKVNGEEKDYRTRGRVFDGRVDKRGKSLRLLLIRMDGGVEKIWYKTRK